METVDLGQEFENHMVHSINKLTAPKAEWPNFKDALRHQIHRKKVRNLVLGYIADIALPFSVRDICSPA